MKDHIIAAVVNDLRDTAIKFHNTQQLRERLRGCIELLLDAAAPQVATNLPKWIDEKKGSDPLADDLIAYIEQNVAPQVVADERAHEIMNSMAVHVDDWADGLDYEPSKTEVSGKALHYILSRVAAPAQAQEPAAGTAVEAVLLSDMVEGSHPQYGNGLFATENCVTTLYRAPVQPVAVPDGWKLVPLEATRAMIDAASAVEEDGFDAMHKAMLAAAPAAPAAPGDAKELAKEDMHEAYYAYSGNSEIDYDGREWSNFMGGWNAAIAAKAAS